MVRNPEFQSVGVRDPSTNLRSNSPDSFLASIRIHARKTQSLSPHKVRGDFPQPTEGQSESYRREFYNFAPNGPALSLQMTVELAQRDKETWRLNMLSLCRDSTCGALSDGDLAAETHVEPLSRLNMWNARNDVPNYGKREPIVRLRARVVREYIRGFFVFRDR